MLSFVTSKDEQTLAIEVEGKMTKEDLEKFDNVVFDKFRNDEKFSVYAVIGDIDTPSAGAIFEELAIDAKRWSQYNKLAVVSEKDWLTKITGVIDKLPGVQVKHFPLDQMEQAWNWIKEG
ncbi:STAS/SEC14 domain-containing protein [Planococcus sp. ISL-109]|uniref:STAS/SEC14 domain-containing protein n=1 Tax=Planococcus sp. ISL-109 TaxID=2819166 RepID=UPI001BE6A107|nr:STAS/SEC14 domain-containing protein [Planococcus sp. ISL-109]MBT2581509.1 STAS/SEC14 domain-containing protein [Planococcus sp. ISL-109]